MMATVRKGWHNPPPVMILAGSEEFLRRRELRKALAGATTSGRAVEWVDGEDASALSNVMGSADAFGEPVLAVVSNPDKVGFETVEAHHAAGDNAICLLLYQEGKIRKGSVPDKVADLIDRKFRIEFNGPAKAHEVKDFAAKFVVTEARGQGIEISVELVDALVDKVGTDLGVLYFEVVKVAAYLSALGVGSRVTPEHLRATMTRSGEADLLRLANALGAADVRTLLREMDDIGRGFAGDEGARTMAACGLLGTSVTRWLHAAILDAGGAGEEEAALRMSVHPFIYKKFILPVAKRWGSLRLAALMKRVAKAEIAVKTGHISPWVELTCGLVSACRGVAARG
jgi:DNA polymerase III delta subunit